MSNISGLDYIKMQAARAKQQRLAGQARRATIRKLWVEGLNRAEIMRWLQQQGIHQACYGTICKDIKIIRSELAKAHQCPSCGQRLPRGARQRIEHGVGRLGDDLIPRGESGEGEVDARLPHPDTPMFENQSTGGPPIDATDHDNDSNDSKARELDEYKKLLWSGD